MPSWGYDPKSNRYRNLTNGQYVSHDTVIEWADAFADATKEVLADYASQLASGTLRLDQWQALMREEIRRQYIDQYLAGRGAIGQMTQQDWGIIGRMLRDQYHYLDDFAADIAAGKLTEGQIRARSQMYIDAAHEAFERARCQAFGMPLLPAYPADGQTQCLTHCKCNWIIEPVYERQGRRKVQTGWNAFWRLNPAVHCPDCPENEKLWSPLFVPAGMTPAEADIWRAQEIDRMLEHHS